MKQRWTGVLLALVTSLCLSVPLGAGTALADQTFASASCPQAGSNDLCHVLLVTLDGHGATLPTSGVKIEVKRQIAFSSDNDFFLGNAANGKSTTDWTSAAPKLTSAQYTSWYGISGTASQGTGYPCSSPASVFGKGHNSDLTTFSITVTGPNGLTGTATANLCQGAPSFDAAWITAVTVGVNMNASPGTNGGITGTSSYSNANSGNSGPCTANSFVNITGGPKPLKASDQYQVKVQGSASGDKTSIYKSNLDLPAGTGYSAEITCFDTADTGLTSAGAYRNKVNNITITANKFTSVDFLNTNLLNAGGGTYTPAPTPPTVVVQPTPCDVGSLSFAICPVIGLINKTATKTITTVILPLLVVTPYDVNNPLKPLWQALLYLSDTFFAVIFMLIIFGQTFGLQNYSIKKILPRLITAAILIQFSYFISGFMIDVGNILGAGVIALIGALPGTQPHTMGDSLNLIGGVISGILAFGAVAILGIGLVGFAALTVLIGLISILVTLVFRQIFIAVLVVTAPLAIAAWVLPNTERYFKLWFKNMIKLNLIYVMVALIIGVSGVLAQAGITVTDIDSAKGIADGSATLPKLITKGILSLLPIFGLMLIGTVIKGSGTIMSGVTSKIASRSGRMSGAAKQRAAKPAKAMVSSFNSSRAARIQEKNLMSSRKGGVRGRISAARAGFVSNNDNTRRQLQTAKDAALSAKATSQAVADMNSGVNRVNTSVQLQQRTSAAQDKILDGRVSEQLIALRNSTDGLNTDPVRLSQIAANTTISDAERIAAVQQLSTIIGSSNDINQLRINTFGGTDSQVVAPENTALWDKAVSRMDSERNPDMFKPLNRAFEDVGANELAAFDAPTTQRYVDYVGRSGNEKLKTQLNGAVAGITGSSNLRSKVQGVSIQHIQKSGLLNDEMKKYVTANYNSTGQFLGKAGAATGSPISGTAPGMSSTHRIRISEHLVDPRVEGETKDQVR